MARLGAVPRLVQCLVPARRRVMGHQIVQGRRRGLCLRHVARRERIDGERTLLESLHLQRRQHVQPLGAHRVGARAQHFLGHAAEELGGLGGLVGLAVQLDGLQLLALLEEVRAVLGEEPLDLRKVVLLRQLNRLVPLVKEDAAVDRRLHVPQLQKRRHRAVAHAHRLELFAHVLQEAAPLGQRIDDLVEAGKVFDGVVAGDEGLEVVRLLVALHRLGPLLAVRVVVADLVVRHCEELVVATARLHEVDDAEPVAEAHAELDGEVLAVDVPVQLLGLVEPLEVRRDLGALLGLVIEHLQLHDKLYPLIVLARHEGLLRELELELLQRSLGE